jgi:hypothetical protein
MRGSLFTREDIPESTLTRTDREGSGEGEHRDRSKKWKQCWVERTTFWWVFFFFFVLMFELRAWH